MERVDILLATYNGEKYLREQLDSLLRQTYKNIRIIISDDKSTDSTQTIIKEYKLKDERIVFFSQEKNLGVVLNFEFLLKKVQSKYYMFADQDDIWNDDKIEKSLNRLKEMEADIVFTDLQVVDDELNIINKSYWELKGLKQKILKYNGFNALYLNNYVTGCTMIAKSETIQKILPIPSSSKYILHDYWTALMISQNGKIEYLNEPTIKYRQHKNNKIGSKKKSETLESLKEIRELFLEVKLEHFEIFNNKQEKFESEKIKELNIKSLKYYKYLKKVKYINFKDWNLFFKLYKYENKKYVLENFLILNLPIIAVPLIKIRKRFKKGT